jgi:sugar lactone lactonase YvrE
MFAAHHRISIAWLLALGLAACAGGTAPPTAPLQTFPQSQHEHNAPASCVPVHHRMVVNPASLTLTSTATPGTFTACTRHSSSYAVSVSPAGVVQVPAKVWPVKGRDATYAATISVGALANGTATITVTDDRHNSAKVPVVVSLPQSTAHLFISALGYNIVSEYAQPFTSAPITAITSGVISPSGLAFDASGDLFIASCGVSCGGAGKGSVTEYAPPYTNLPLITITSGIANPYGLAVDSSGNLFVANYSGNSVTEYAPPYTAAPLETISSGVSMPFGVALDASGHLFVANFGANTVTGYAPPYTSPPTATITNGINAPQGLALDSAGNLFVGNQAGNVNPNVTEYASPYTGSPVKTITSGVGSPYALAVDHSGDLFVANYNASVVNEYAAPYTAAPAAAITNNVLNPAGIAILNQ